jgi:hypothetical protein
VVANVAVAERVHCEQEMAVASGDAGVDLYEFPLVERQSWGYEGGHFNGEFFIIESCCLEPHFGYTYAAAKPRPVRDWLAGPLAEANKEAIQRGFFVVKHPGLAVPDSRSSSPTSHTGATRSFRRGPRIMGSISSSWSSHRHPVSSPPPYRP